jgi:hypothetical protein
MKKVFLVMLMIFGALNMSAQTLCKMEDEFSGKVSYWSDKAIFAYESGSEEKGLRLDFYIKVYNEKLILSEFIVKAVGVGCVDTDSEMVILFENGEAETFKSWNKFNCKGTSYMSMTTNGKSLLSQYKISKIRFTNKQNYNRVTVEVPEEFASNVITLYAEINRLNGEGFSDISKCE